MSKYKNTDRIIFPSGEQRRFLLESKKLANVSWSDFAAILEIHPRLLLSYRKEVYSISFKILRTIMKISKMDFPNNIRIENQFWNKGIAGKIGGEAVLKKYGKIGGDEQYRKEQWRKWWETKGSKKPSSILARQDVRLPKHCQDFAELCGILIGDGGISKYQMIITLNGETDKKYSEFVVNLLYKLFNIITKIHKVKGGKAISLVISRSNLVDFLVSEGLKIGHKINQRVSIPDWIMNSKKYKISCLRGLVDTDGSVVIETHRIKGKEYVYPRLNFTSASPDLIRQVFLILSELGFRPKIRRKERSVQLENLQEICKYFDIVSSSNPKHLQRISRWY